MREEVDIREAPFVEVVDVLIDAAGRERWVGGSFTHEALARLAIEIALLKKDLEAVRQKAIWGNGP